MNEERDGVQAGDEAAKREMPRWMTEEPAKPEISIGGYAANAKPERELVYLAKGPIVGAILIAYGIIGVVTYIVLAMAGVIR